jgi:hypothetical protein
VCRAVKPVGEPDLSDFFSISTSSINLGKVMPRSRAISRRLVQNSSSMLTGSRTAKSLWYENGLENQGVRSRFQKTDISEFESSHPSHAVGLSSECPRSGLPEQPYAVSQSRLSDSNIAKCVVCLHTMEERDSGKVPIYTLVQRPEEA